MILDSWEISEPRSDVDAQLVLRAPALLDMVGSITGFDRIERVKDAVAARDPHAIGTLVALNEALGAACQTMLQRCARWRREREWTALRHEAAFTAALTVAAERPADRATALFLLATAYRANDDLPPTIAAYQEAIAIGLEIGDDRFLGSAFDNLGNALADDGKLDEALASYDRALEHEHDLRGRRAIFANRANALSSFGEYRSAARVHQQVIQELEAAGLAGPELAIALDNAAAPIASLGECETALALLERARPLFADDDLAGSTVNALGRAEVNAMLGDDAGASAAFLEAHELAFANARRNIDPDHYRQGFQDARAARLPVSDEAVQLWVEGVRVKDRQWPAALEYWRRAKQGALAKGDVALALRLDANTAAILGDAGQVDDAVSLALTVRREAAARGYAQPELMALGTLASLAQRGVDVHQTLGPLGALAMAKELQVVLQRIVADAGIEGDEAAAEAGDTGVNANQLSKLALDNRAYELAVRYLTEAVATARALTSAIALVNRLAGLRLALVRAGRLDEADAVATDLASLVADPDLPDLGQAVGHRALAWHVEATDRPAAIEHLREAAAALERMRGQVTLGPRRADVSRQFDGLYRKLAHLLREEGDFEAAFEALQGEKGRRLIDALAALQQQGDSPDTPATAAEVAALLGRLGDAPTELVDLALGDEGITAYLVGADGVRAVHVPGDPSALAATERGDTLEREASVASLCLRDPLLLALAGALTAALSAERRLLLVPDLYLHNFPLHAIPVEGQPLCDWAAIGYLPAAGSLRFAPGHRTPVGRSLVAGDSRGDLPYAAEECAVVAEALGTAALVGTDCTRAAIEAALTADGELDVVHLAVHGRGDTRRGGRASLLLGDGLGGTAWTAFDELAALSWRVELVVFSGCSTAVAGPRQGHELVGVARAAAEAGASAVIACLWPVGDDSAAIFMRAFYKRFAAARAQGPVDLRVLLNDARAALRDWLRGDIVATGRRRDGRGISLVPEAPVAAEADPELASTLSWAPFILLGDPVLG